MYYPEYAIAARTHYQSCKFLYDSCIKENDIKSGGTPDILYRLLYLCGHVIECASIYLIFNHFRYYSNPNVKNWNSNDSHLHKSYNPRFTRDSHIDFYQIKILLQLLVCLFVYQFYMQDIILELNKLYNQLGYLMLIRLFNLGL